MSAVRWLFPAVMFCGVAFILMREGMPWWAAVLVLTVVGGVAYAQHESHRPDTEDEA